VGSLLGAMDTPPPDPHKLLEHWMAWEKGEVTPGRTLADLKTGGLRQVLEDLVAALEGGPPG
jgi:hypothetical protein